MCAPPAKQAVLSPSTQDSSGNAGGSPAHLHGLPSATGASSQASAGSWSPQYGLFTNPATPSGNPVSTHLFLQTRDNYQNSNNNSTNNDCSDSDFCSQPKPGKIWNTKSKLVWYLQQKGGVILTAVVFILYFNIIGWMGCYGLLFVSLQEEFGRNATETGWVGSLAFIVNCLCTPFNDLLRRRLSNRSICVVGILCCSVSLLATSFMPQLCYLFFTFSFLYGLGSGLVFKSCLDLLLNYYPDNCGRVSFLVLTGSTAGTFVWTPFNTALIDQLGWRNTCRISSAIILVVCLFLTLPLAAPSLRKPKAASDHKDATSETHYSKLTPPKKQSRVQSKDEIKWAPPREKKLLRMPEAWFFGFGCLAPFISMGFFNVNLVSYATSLGYSSHQGATVLTIAAASEAGSKMIFALFVDKLPFRKVHLMTVLSVFATIITLSCAFVPSFPILCVVAVGIGLTRATMNALPFPVGMEIFGPAKTSGSNTLILFAGGLGTITSAFVIGGTFDALGSYNVAIYICSGCFLLTTIVFALIPLTSKLYKVTRVKVRFDEVTGAAEMVPVVEDEVFMIEEFVTVL